MQEQKKLTMESGQWSALTNYLRKGGGNVFVGIILTVSLNMCFSSSSQRLFYPDLGIFFTEQSM